MPVNKKYKKGLCWGVWDMFHIGHLNLLQNAKELCDYLIVCVSDDEYVEEHKGKRPIINFVDRMRIVSNIKFVNKVNIQTEFFGKKEAVEYFKPDVLFVGDDWNKDTFTGEGLGVPVIYLPYTKGISSSKLRKGLKL